MPTLLKTPRTFNRLLAACLALAPACAGENSVEPGARRVCVDCVPRALGQGSSSLAGFVAACSLAYLERTIDRAEAEALGFPVTDAAALIERPIDTPAMWVPRSTEGGGGPAGGYEPATRVRAALKVESYLYRWLDPARCDGTVCRLDDGSTTPQLGCYERYIMMHVSGELETLDGAIAVRFPTQPVNMSLPGQTDAVGVAAAADLSDVRGTLTLEPDVPTPWIGRVDLSLQFADSQRREYGVVGVSVVPDWGNLTARERPSIPGRAHYSPVAVQWGAVPFGSPTTVPVE